MHLLTAGIVLASIQSPAISSSGRDFALHNGDRVVFYGDSITDNSPYSLFVEAYVNSRFPNLDVRFFNAGVGGDRVTGGGLGNIDKRLPRDLFSRKPTVVTVMLGMNDAAYRPFDQSIFDTFRNGYQHIVDQFKSQIPNARIFLLQPSPFDDVTRDISIPGGYNEVLKRYGTYVAEVARFNNYGLIDQNTPLVLMLQAAKVIDPNLASKILPDRIHPSAAGHLVMAEAILKAWGAPSIVSSVSIDAKAGTSTVINGIVSNIKLGNSLKWTCKEASLPFLLNRNDPQIKLVLQSSDFDQALNQEILKVTNLTEGIYRLIIDGTPVGGFSAASLADGVNLAQIGTPMSYQAGIAFNLALKRSTTAYFRWRNLEIDLSFLAPKDVAPSLRAYEKAEEELIRLERQLVKTTPHNFELVRV